MPTRNHDAAATQPNLCFVNELRGETPPSLAAMENLYRMAAELFALRPWRLLEENQLILVRHPRNGDFCYCSVMGALGEVFSMHAYLGAESYRMFRKLESGKTMDPGEFLASQTCVYVEFVPRAELEAPDRKLLAALGRTISKGARTPFFRAIRPGFHPWFVTDEEASILATCLQAVLAVCSEAARQKVKYWSRPNTFPLFVPGEDAGSYSIELIKPALSAEPPLPPAQVSDKEIAQLRGKDYALRGAMELDYIVSMVAVGEKNQRKACTSIGLAVDAATGIVYPPELAPPGVALGDVLAKTLIRAIQSTGAYPAQVRVRNRRLKDCLQPLAESLGLSIGVAARLPALDEARESLLRLF